MSDYFNHNVQYRPIPGHPDYFVGEDGSVFSQRPYGPFKEGRIGKLHRIKISRDDDGYCIFSLCYRDGGKTARLHQIVLLAFGFERPSPNHEVRHLNGIKDDNRLENLRWGTPQENDEDRDRHCTRRRGESHGNSKLTKEKVHQIRYEFADMSLDDLAEKFNVDRTTIWHIRIRKTWKHVP